MTQTPTLAPPSATPPQNQNQPVYQQTDDDRARVAAIAAAWQAYDGNFDAQLEKTPEGIDPNVIVNQCAPIVDTGVDFLFGKEVEISVEAGAPKAAQAALDAFWGQKEARIPFLQDLAMNGAMARNAFLRIVPGSNKPGQPKTFRKVAVDPSTVFVQTAPQDCETVLLYCIEYSATEQVNGKDAQVYYREEITRIDPDGNASKGLPDDDDTWQIQHWTKVAQAGQQPKNSGWTPAGEPYTWPYPFPPIFHCKNLPRPNEFWGRADIRPDIIGMNKTLNLDLSCIMLDEILYGQPILYANGMGNGRIDRKAGSIIELPLPESKITAVNIPSDIPNALAFATDMRSSIDETSKVPGVAIGRIKDMPRGTLSGIAIELLFMAILKQTDKKKNLYGKLMIDVSKAILVLNGFSGDIDITLAWQSPLPHDDLPAVQAAIAKKEINISNTTLQRELGYDPEEEQALKQSEAEQALAQAQQAMQSAATDGIPPGIIGAPTLPGQKYPVPGQPAPSGQAPQQAQTGGKPA